MCDETDGTPLLEVVSLNFLSMISHPNDTDDFDDSNSTLHANNCSSKDASQKYST